MRMQEVRRIVADKLGLRITHVIDTKKGYNSRIFFLKTNGPELVLKEQRRKYNRLVTEAWALKLLGKKGIPAPKVLIEDFKDHFVIDEKIEGTTLQNAKLSAEAKRKILKQIGGYVRRIHSIKTKGYGYFKRPGVGNKSSWREHMDKDFYTNLNIVKKKGIVSKELLGRIKRFYKKHNDVLEYYDPRLLHGDLRFENFIVEDSRFRSFIDLGQAWSGDPLSELAILYNELMRQDPRGRMGLMKSFENGYGKRIDVERMGLYLIDLWVWDLQMQGLIRKDRSAVERIIGMINHLIKADP